MMNDILLYEVLEVQKEYKDLLVCLREVLAQNNSAPILDEIEVFWYKHRNLVKNAIRYLSKPYHTYVFTAAVILDIDDLEHYPFLCLGDYHIWDDPIFSYIRMKEKSPNEVFNKEIEEQINRTIGDNIRIISELNDYILILPIRMISEVNPDDREKASKKAFFNLFKQPPTSISDYLKNYSSIEDIDRGIVEEIKDMIIFSENDTTSDDFIKRFNADKEESQLPIRENASDAEIFLIRVLGYISQAIDIISNAVAYRFVPYIRYNVAFKYTLILYGAFEEIPEGELWINKLIIAHILHKTFDKESIKDICVQDYTTRIIETGFEKNLFRAIEKEKVFTEKRHPKLLINIIDKTIKDSLQKQN